MKYHPSRKFRLFIPAFVGAVLAAISGGALGADGWEAVPLGGGGYVTGLASDSSGSTIYCRTDVGGAFRWAPAADGVNGSWVSLTDHMMPYGTAGASGLMNVEGIAVDPNDPKRLYIGAGGMWGLRGIFTSADKGETWTQVNATIRMQGNGKYRANGERLAVDPNDAKIVWYGSTVDGLQKGVKSGEAWTWTQIAPASVPIGAKDAGISFVVCDKNGGKTMVYAGVYDPAAGGVYRSADAGATWSKVEGAPLPQPGCAQIASNGTLYVTGGTGGVAKLPRGGALALITPTTGKDGGKAVSFHAVAVDLKDAAGNVVYAAQSTGGSGKLWRSADGGTTWAMQDKNFNGEPGANHKRMEPDGTPCLTGYWFGSTATMLMNPANPGELWLGDFFGVTRTRNAQEIGATLGATWNTLQKGQEETVVLSLKTAPSGAKLMAGLADVGGFRYLNTKVRPSGAAGNGIGNPHGGNTTSLDFCESNPTVWVRGLGSPSGWGGTGGVSNDGGVTWLRFGQIAGRVVTNDKAAGWESWDVGTYLAKQKAKGATAVTLVVASSNTVEFSSSAVSFDSREATDPAVRPKLVINGATNLGPTADTRVEGASPTTNYGNAPTLLVSYAWGPAVNSKWSFLKFDLSGAPAVITSATLQLNRRSSTNAIKFPVGVYTCADTKWVEGDGGGDNLPADEMIWNNRPPTLANGDNGNPRGGDPGIDYPTPNYYCGKTHLWGGRIAISAVDPNVLVWSPVNAGLHYSNDRGVTWTPSTGAPGSQITGVYTNGNSLGMSGQPITSDRVNGNFYFVKVGGGKHEVFRSTDQGATWKAAASVANGNSYNVRTPQLVGAPASPACPQGGDVWLCDDGTYNKQGGGLWRSIDGAATWKPFAGVEKVTAVSFGKAAGGSGYTVFICGDKGGAKGLFRSDDYGATWEALPNPTIEELTALAGDRQSYNSVFIGTGGRGVMHYEGKK